MDYLTAAGVIMDANVAVNAMGELKLYGPDSMSGFGWAVLLALAVCCIGFFLLSNDVPGGGPLAGCGTAGAIMTGMVFFMASFQMDRDKHANIAFDKTRAPCEIVLSAISSGEMRDLGPLQPRRLAAVCGGVAVLAAVNSDGSRIALNPNDLFAS